MALLINLLMMTAHMFQKKIVLIPFKETCYLQALTNLNLKEQPDAMT